MPVEIHAIRLGDMAIATNRFELYLDFGIRIKARSKAVQTFVVQLAGPSLKTEKAREVLQSEPTLLYFPFLRLFAFLVAIPTFFGKVVFSLT